MSKVRRWTKTEEDLMRQLYPTKGADGVLHLLPGITREQVWSKAKHMGVAAPKVYIDYWPRTTAERTADAALIGWRTPVEPQALRWSL